MSIENASGQLNYICGNAIYLLSEINPKSMAELIGRVGDLVSKMPTVAPDNAAPDIVNPYDIADNRPTIDIFINSGGGEMTTALSLMSQLARARARGARIRTTVMTRASSAASQLAVFGDKGMRIMYESAYHFIHYGNQQLNINSAPALEVEYEFSQKRTQTIMDVYLRNTGLSRRDLEKMFMAETGYLDAKESLKRGLCDWILTADGRLIGR